ncbi:hypothetical protein [Corynebacterium epidermidicanis]|uniref:Uncharacterized protein n=1 Tax=Corynebacterium epidermidicanis TaxID=1050174 RepID=A0A0G3GP89_9CORY|nr:hypothetical protein [Corynebacterium epidermidicanis]AKK03041.1 hypothetical protein CEPID_05885 [Corynebacterium epidermidicanis]
MATNSPGPMQWFNSRKNIAGMVLAVVIHLIIGLGPLCPVVAAAAWGLGALLTPNPALPVALATTQNFQ